MDRLRVGIVIPALNEAATIADVVRNVTPYGRAIVVDDGSSDQTASLAREAGAEVVRHPSNRGYEGALNSGFERASQLGCDYVITVDADGQHNPAQLGEFLALLRGGDDLVIGRRDRHQRIGESIFAWAALRLWRISDPLCGMKGYSMRVYDAVGHFDSIRSVGTELAIRAVSNGCRFAEIPVLTRERKDAPRFARALDGNLRILRAMLVLVLLHAFGRLQTRR